MSAPDLPKYKATREGIDEGSFPMQLWRKAKKLGVWDPHDIDLGQDVKDWQGLNPEEQHWLLRLTALFLGGEESVARNLLPLMSVIADEDRIEEEMFLTAYLWEESKHLEAFHRFFKEVAPKQNLGDLLGSAYRQFFYESLPTALNRLRTDPSPQALAEASVTYQLIAEGVLAETGYFNYHSVLKGRDIMPGMQQIVRFIQRDEARHLAYGVFLLSRLQAEHGNEITKVIERCFNELFPLCLNVAGEGFDLTKTPPFGFQLGVFTNYARAQYQNRVNIIRRTSSYSMEEIWYGRAKKGDPR